MKEERSRYDGGITESFDADTKMGIISDVKQARQANALKINYTAKKLQEQTISSAKKNFNIKREKKRDIMPLFLFITKRIFIFMIKP